MDYEVGNESVSRGRIQSSGGGDNGGSLPPEIQQSQSPAPQPEENLEGEEKGFLDHLEELRWHLIRSVSAIFIFALVGFASSKIVFGVILLGPSEVSFLTYQLMCDLSQALDTPLLCIDKLPFIIQNRTMMGQFSAHIMSSLAIGFVVAFPYAFWEVWRFVKPGLYQTEQKASRGATFAVTALFVIGILFGYFIVTPLSINFLSNYQIDPSIVNEIDLTSYINTVVMITLACGIMFQLPMVVYFLSKVGVVTPSFMRTYRRHAIVIIMLLGAVITPPDVFSQILIAIPVFVLYEASISISARVQRQREKEALAFMQKHEE